MAESCESLKDSFGSGDRKRCNIDNSEHHHHGITTIRVTPVEGSEIGSETLSVSSSRDSTLRRKGNIILIPERSNSPENTRNIFYKGTSPTRAYKDWVIQITWVTPRDKVLILPVLCSSKSGTFSPNSSIHHQPATHWLSRTIPPKLVDFTSREGKSTMQEPNSCDNVKTLPKTYLQTQNVCRGQYQKKVVSFSVYYCTSWMCQL